MKLIKCPECDSEINDGDSKCNNCGFPIDEIVKTAPASAEYLHGYSPYLFACNMPRRAF